MPARRRGDGRDASGGCWGPRSGRFGVPRKEGGGGQQGGGGGAGVVGEVSENAWEVGVELDGGKEGEEVEFGSGEVEGVGEMLPEGVSGEGSVGVFGGEEESPGARVR